MLKKIVQVSLFVVTFGAGFFVAPKKANAECCSINPANTGYCTLINGMRTCVGGGYSCNHNCW